MQKDHKPLANILLKNSMCVGRSDGVYAGVVDNHEGKTTSKGERIGAINAERRSLIMKKVAFLTTAIIPITSKLNPNIKTLAGNVTKPKK